MSGGSSCRSSGRSEHACSRHRCIDEFCHLARLRDRFRRSAAYPDGRIPRPSAQPLREAVAPYEAELDDLRRLLQSKHAEVDGLKEKLATATSRRNQRLLPSKKHHQNIADAGVSAPTAELFVACAEQARAATREFAAHLLHLLSLASSRTWSPLSRRARSRRRGFHRRCRQIGVRYTISAASGYRSSTPSPSQLPRA